MIFCTRYNITSMFDLKSKTRRKFCLCYGGFKLYISNIKIQNFRNFVDLDVNFHEDINIIIGHNNTGKSNLIRALALIFDSNTKKQLNTHDFNKYIALEDLKEAPPKVSISVTISQSKGENLISDDLATVSDWLIKLENPYEALLTYEYFLPTEECERYKKMVLGATKTEEVWQIIEDEFIRLYTYKIWGGNPANQSVADSEWLQKFDFQFLDAIRDVERDMFTGKNTLLKNVFDFFMDYDIKSDESKSEDKKIEKIKDRKYKFMKDANDLLGKLKSRMEKGQDEILEYANNIGALFDKSSPDFEGSITDVELYSALKLIVKYSEDVKIPITHNGLGYNNLIFMSLLLSKMQVDADGKYLGSNAKVFPILAIEEPEAHLHPTMQYQFLEFLSENKKDNKVRQIFVTTHSTHIVASTFLDNIICLYKENNRTLVAYPSKALHNEKSKKYVQRFLDATKSDMLFAEKIILVEGVTEQLLLSIFATYLELSLEKNHVSVINIGSRYFDHFLLLFDKNNSNAINKKVACLIDIDPSRKKKIKGSRYEKCYPFEYNVNHVKYEYQQNPFLKERKFCKDSNIRFFTQDEKYGKTFEYDLALKNPTLELLLTESISNKEELKSIMNLYKNGASLKELMNSLYDSQENERIIKSLENASKEWEEDDKKKALIASRYLNSVSKGENALELAYALQDNWEKKGTQKYQDFEIPDYIRDAIEWVCENDN